MQKREVHRIKANSSGHRIQFKDVIIIAFSPCNLFLSGSNIIPAPLNNCSDGTLVAGAAKYFLAKVDIRGNGPSALSLSAFLSGYKPYYDKENPHPNDVLNAKLLQNADVSIINQDIESLSVGLHGRSDRAVSVLYDSLVRPDADLGESFPSSLTWRKDGDSCVSHVCLGAGEIGGSWAGFNPDTLTLSFGSWLDLPVYSFECWLADNNEKTYRPSDRIPFSVATRYFADYARILKLQGNTVFGHALVTKAVRIKDEKFEAMISKEGPKTADDPSNHFNWLVSGYFEAVDEKVKRPFTYCAKRLILACGATSPKRLHIAPENSSLLLHSDDFRHIDKAISRLKSSILASNAQTKCKFLREIHKCCGSNAEKHNQFHESMKHKNQSLDKLNVARTGMCFSPETTRCAIGLRCKCTTVSQSQIATLCMYLYPIDEACTSVTFCPPALVVGDGLTAADNVITLLKAGIPVIHSFRKPLIETTRLAISKLSRSLYPKYNAVYKLMTSKLQCCAYKAYPATEVISISPRAESIVGQSFGPTNVPSSLVILRSRNLLGHEGNFFEDEITLFASLVIVSIGSKPNLAFLGHNYAKSLAVDPKKPLDLKTNPILIDSFSGRCLNDQTVYALGPLVGDNLVRFLVGGAMATAKNLMA